MLDADTDASRAEAERLLTDAGWRQVLVAGSLVGGVDPVGNVHLKDWTRIPPGHALYSEDTPDTPHEAAAWLVAKFTNGAPIEGPKYRFRRKSPTAASVVDIFEAMPEAAIAAATGAARAQEADMAQPININVSPVFNVTGGNATNDANAGAENETQEKTDLAGNVGEETAPQTDASTEGGEHVGAEESDAGSLETAGSLADETPLPESPPADEPAAEPVADPVDSGAGDAAAGDAEGAADGPASGGREVLAYDGQDGAGDSELPVDYEAEFEEVGSADEVSGDTAAALLALEDQGAVQPQPADEPSGVAYFGDDFPTMKLKKIGRLTVIASEQTTAALAFANWSDDEYTAAQTHVVSNLNKATGAYTGDRQDLYNRFVELSEVRNHVDTINRHRDQSVAYLSAPDTPRELIAQFDPEAGWPA